MNDSFDLLGALEDAIEKARADRAARRCGECRMVDDHRLDCGQRTSHRDRPSDLEIAHYINDLENALATAGATCLTRSELFDAVHPWAAELVAPGGWIKAAGSDPIDDD